MSDTASLKSNVLSAVGWSAGTRFVGQILNWAMTLLVVRFLRPEDYGLMGLAMAVTGFLQSLSYVGISDAVVQSRSIDEEGLRSVLGLVILVNGALLLLLCLLAAPLAAFFGDLRLTPLLRAASFIFVLIAIQAIPNARLQKRLDLKTVSRIEMTGNLVSGVLVLVLAWIGFGVWSLMISMLVNTGIRAAGLCWVEPFWRIPSFKFRGYMHILHNGGIRTAEQALWYLYNSSDIFLIGKLLGPVPLGVYAVARQVAAIPVDKLATVIKPAAFPAFSMVQNDKAEALRYLCKAMRLIALISFPVFFGISAIAPQIVQIVLGPQWTNATMPLALLALSMALRPVGLILPSFLMGIGQFRTSFANTLFGTVLFPAAYAIGSFWGVEGVCWAAIIAYPIQFLVLVRACARRTDSSTIALLRPLVRPLFGALAMFGCVLLGQAMLPAGSVWMRLGILITTGILVYGAFVLVFCRSVSLELLALARR